MDALPAAVASVLEAAPTDRAVVAPGIVIMNEKGAQVAVAAAEGAAAGAAAAVVGAAVASTITIQDQIRVMGRGADRSASIDEILQSYGRE